MITVGGIYGIRHFGEEQILYIGKTKNNFYIRWGQHLTSLLNPKLPQLPWYDVERNNLNNLDFIILHDCRAYPVEDDNILAELEKRYIKEYEPIYNIRGNKEKRMQEKQKQILKEFFKDKEGEILTKEKKKKWVQEIKDKGFTNSRQARAFSFDTIKNYCQKLHICFFKKIIANKKQTKEHNLIYRNEYLMVKLFPQEEEQS